MHSNLYIYILVALNCDNKDLNFDNKDYISYLCVSKMSK
jgi:hypothetical protein